MAMATYLQAVSDDEIVVLKDEPSGVSTLDNQPDFHTYHMASINYFVVGDPSPPRETGPLAEALGGSETIKCSLLETGRFDLVPPDRAVKVLDALRGIDVDALRGAIEGADLGGLVGSQTLHDLEDVAPEDAVPTLLRDLEDLTGFYDAIVAAGHGVVMYAT